MSVNSQVVLFAIQAAVRLEGQVRQVQIDKIRDNRLNLLTPKFRGLNFKSAVRWFTREGAASIANNPNFILLVDRAERREGLSGRDQQRLIDEYIQRRNVQDGLVEIDTSYGLSSDNVFAVTNVAQWQSNAGRYPSPLQRICGSLIEIGVDYFKNYSGLINTDTTQGKMLMSFFDAIDEIDFAEGQLQDIASKMMVSTLEVIDEGVDLISGGSNATLLFKSITKGLVTDINIYITNEGAGSLFKQEQARDWGQLVFKSVLTTAGATVLDNPSKFLSTGTGSGAAEMVTSGGNSLLSSILEDVDAGNGVVVSLKNVFTTDTLSKVTQASFEVLAQHPEWYDIDNEGLKNVLTALIKEVATYPNSLGMDMLPDLATLILTQTAGNLQLIYQGDPTDSASNLLVTATGLVIKTLQQGIPTEDGQPWQPVFTKTQIIGLVDGVLQEVISNPDWILAKAEDANPLLEDVLAAVFQSLQGVSVGSLSTETKMSIVKSAISAVALRQDLLDKLNIDGEETQLLNYGIDIVLDLAFGQKSNAKTKWALANSLAISLLIDGVLSRIAKEGASEEVVNLTKEFLEGEIEVLTNGQPFDINAVVAQLKSGNTLQQLLQNSINAGTRITATLLVENPNAIKIGNAGVKNIVNHLVQTLASYPSDINTALLPKLALMIITDTSANLGTIVGANTDDPAKNLLVLAGQTALNQLGSEDVNGAIQFSYTSDQAMSLLDTVFQNVVSNPTWVLDAAGNASPILENALSAAMSSLKGISLQNMSNDTKINVLKSAVSAVALRQDLLNKVSIDGEEKALLSGGIELVLNLAFGQKATAKAKWALMSNQVMGELMQAVLGRVAKEGASESVLNLVDEFLQGELEALTDGGNFDIDVVIAKLKSGETLNVLLQNSINSITRISATLIAENIDRLRIDNQGVKNIVTHLVTTLSDYPAKFSQAILPDLASMILLDTSDNLGTIVGSNADDPSKNLLVLAGQIVLNTLGETDVQGKMTMKFTTNQVLDLLDNVLQQVVSKPQWILAAVGGTDPLLATALKAALTSLGTAKVLNLSNDAIINILKASISAVAMDRGFMEKVGVNNELVMSMSLEVVFKTVDGDLSSANLSAELMVIVTETAKEKIRWAMSDNDTIEELTEAVLRRVVKEGTSEKTIELVNTLLAHEVLRIAKSEPFSLNDLIEQLDSPNRLIDLIGDFITPN